MCYRWRFHLQELSDGHWVSVARGPPENIVDAWQEFTGTLKEPIIPTSRFQVSLTFVALPKPLQPMWLHRLRMGALLLAACPGCLQKD